MAINTTVENINNQPTIQPQTVTGIFTKYIAKVIPLAFDESMSYYECICALLKYLNETIVPDINNTNAGLSELQTFYLQLQNYVNTYFDNLDVQEEINNKLDDMVEQGTLQELIADYLNSKAVFGFDNVAGMKLATNLINGSYAKTLGYYNKNDGGSSLYKIRTITNDDVVNEMNIIALNDNTLIAELIHIPNEINIACLGAKYNDNTFNSSTILQYAVNNYDNIIINGSIYLGSKITINRDNVNINQTSGYIYPTFTNDDLFRITGQKNTMHVKISGEHQEKDNNVSTTYSAIFVGDGGTLSGEKGSNFNFSYSVINGYYGNGVKHVNGAFGDYSYALVRNCNGHAFYFPGGCLDNQLHNLSFAHAVNNKGIGYYLTDDTSDNTYTHDSTGILYPSTFCFNVTKAYGNAQNFNVNCGKHFGSIYSEVSTTTHDYWKCYRSTITYWAAAEEARNFTDEGTDNIFRYVDSWDQPITTNEMFNKVTITTTRIGRQEFSQTANNSFNDIVVGDNVNPIEVLHTKQSATKRTDSFENIKLGDITLRPTARNSIITLSSHTINPGDTYNYYGDEIGQMYLNLSTTIPKIFVTAYHPSGAISVTASLYNRGSSGWTPIMFHITNVGAAAIDVSTCQFYLVVMD